MARVGDTLVIRPASGPARRFVTDTNDGDEFVRYLFREYQPALGFYLLEVQNYESSGAVLVNAASGRTTYLTTIPVVSPDRHRFALASSSLETCEESTALTIAAFDADTIRVEYANDLGSCEAPWGPLNARWASAGRLVFDLEYPPDHTKRASEPRHGQLTLQGRTWRLALLR